MDTVANAFSPGGLAGPRATSPGSGLLWALGTMTLFWLLGPAGIFALLAGDDLRETAREAFPQLATWKINFIASDLSRDVLNRARAGSAQLIFPTRRTLERLALHSSFEDIAMDVACSPRWSASFPGFTAPFVHPDPEQWQRDLELVGLQVSDLRVDDLVWDFGSREAFVAWCAVGFGGWTSDLSVQDGQEFVDDVVAAYATEFGSDHVVRFLQLVGKLTKP